MEDRDEGPDGLTDRERDALARRGSNLEGAFRAEAEAARNAVAERGLAVRDLTTERAVQGLCIATPGAGPLQCPTSLDLSTERGKVAFLNAMNRPDTVLDSSGQALVEIADWLAYPRVDQDPESGEVKEYSCLVLIGADGMTFATTSPVVAHRLAQAVRLHGCSHFDPPLPVIIRAVRARKSGRTYHEMEVLPRG